MKSHLLLWAALFCGVISGHGAEPAKVKADPKPAVKVSQVIHAAARPILKADAQLNLKASYDVGEKIIVGCTCKPVDGATIAAEWSFSSGLQSYDIDDLTKCIWAKPGVNKISVKLKLLRTHKLTVLVPGPGWPADPKDVKQQEIEVFDGYTESVLDGEFLQQGAVAPPPVDPPGPGPTPPPPSPQTSGPLRVMILEEADDRRDNKYPTPVVAAYSNAAVFSYLGEHGTPNFTTPVAWDDDYSGADISGKFGYSTDVAQMYEAAKTASGANTPAAKEPWLTVQVADSTGKFVTVYQGQITTDNAALLLPTIQKWGGP